MNRIYKFFILLFGLKASVKVIGGWSYKYKLGIGTAPATGKGVSRLKAAWILSKEL